MNFARILSALTLSCGLFMTAASAQSLDEVVDLWLADNDADALPQLSALAKTGNHDAQLLLGQIEATAPPGSSSLFVTTLTRRERIDLLRSPGGLSGKSWLTVLADEGDPLASALLAARLPDADMDVVRALLDAGELEAAQKLAWEIFDRGRWSEIFALAPEDPLLAELDFVQWMRSYFASPPVGNPWTWLGESPAAGRSGGIMMISLVAPVLAPHLRPNAQLRQYAIAQRGFPAELLSSGNLAFAAGVMRGQMADDPSLATVQAYCEQTCPTDIGFCGLQVIAQVAGTDNIQAADSPLEQLIPQEVFMSSPRAVNQLRRWMGAIGDSSLANADLISQCVREDIRAGSAIQ